tara:strand:- start:437 stop:1195 length:759 start_codon:yes stop_codon:yes gene_type:complete
MISSIEIETYKKNGQIIPDYCLDSVSLLNLKNDLNQFLENQPDKTLDYFPSLIEMDSRWLEYATNPNILNIISKLIGQNIILWGSGLFCKSAKGGKRTPWHQDAEYWPIRPLLACTVWIAIDESNSKNGCIRIMPGTHYTKELFAHENDDDDKIILNREIPNISSYNNEIIDIILKPGMISIHDAYIIHGAEPNNSGKRRAGVAFRYMPSTSYFDRKLAKELVNNFNVLDLSERELHLVKGVNLDKRNNVVI